MHNVNSNNGDSATKKLVVSAMFCAMAYVAMFVFRFKVSFLTFDFKDVFISILSLLYGPAYGVMSAAVVALLELVTVSDTGWYGLVMNFLSSGTFALAIGLVYKHKRTFYGAILAVVTGVVSMVTVMMLANLFITPFYMGVVRTAVINLIPSLLLPFNLCKGVMNAAVMLLLYKPVVSLLRKTKLVKTGNSQYGADMKTVILMIFSVLFIILSLVVIFIVLDGNYDFFR
ncbi:MAG: ECF transporter S component [Clostridia bacterium]|nr:ECF transporter S component [Clostridia bacterium]